MSCSVCMCYVQESLAIDASVLQLNNGFVRFERRRTKHSDTALGSTLRCRMTPDSLTVALCIFVSLYVYLICRARVRSIGNTSNNTSSFYLKTQGAPRGRWS